MDILDQTLAGDTGLALFAISSPQFGSSWVAIDAALPEDAGDFRIMPGRARYVKSASRCRLQGALPTTRIIQFVSLWAGRSVVHAVSSQLSTMLEFRFGLLRSVPMNGPCP